MTAPLRGPELAALAAVLSGAAALLARTLGNEATTDEGVYLASIRELGHGEALGSDVFASQPPGFYWLLRALAFVFGPSLHDLRVAMLVVALLALVAAFALGRALLGPAGGIGAAAALAIAPPFPTEAIKVQSDAPSVALALAALALLASAARADGGGGGRSGVGGALLAGALSVKLLVAPLLLPAALLLARSRRPRRLAAAAALGGAAVAVAVLAPSAGALGALWDDVVGFHVELHDVGTPWLGPNVRTILRYPDLKTPFGALIVPAGLLLSLLAWRRGRPLRLWPLWAGAAASALFLALQRPLVDHHFVLLAAAYAVPAGAAVGAAAAALPRRATVVAAAALALVLVAGYAQESRRLERNGNPPAADAAWAERTLRTSLRPGSFVVSDVQWLPYAAGMRTPGELVDTSFARFESGLRPSDVLDAIRRSRPAAVVFGRAFLWQPELRPPVERLYPRSVSRGRFTIYLRR